MRALLLTLLVACGASPAKPVAQPASPVAEAPAKPADPPATPEPSAPEPHPAFYDRLRDFDGPVPGLPGFSVTRSTSADHCGGTKAMITRAKTVAPADQQLAAVYAIEFPVGLDFDPNNKSTKDASMKRFTDFVASLTRTATNAAQSYATKLKDADPSIKLAAIARLTQIQFHVASVISRAQIPRDVKTGALQDEKLEATYCDTITEMAEPLLLRAEQALDLCRTAISQATVKGFWNDACK